jgi:hypothetical protein
MTHAVAGEKAAEARFNDLCRLCRQCLRMGGSEGMSFVFIRVHPRPIVLFYHADVPQFLLPTAVKRCFGRR